MRSEDPSAGWKASRSHPDMAFRCVSCTPGMLYCIMLIVMLMLLHFHPRIFHFISEGDDST